MVSGGFYSDAQCTYVEPGQHRSHRKPASGIEDARAPIGIAFLQWLLPLPSSAPNADSHRLPFVPSSVMIRNYSDQALYMSTTADNPNDVIARPEIVVPPRVVYQGPFGIRSARREFYWAIPGNSYGNASEIIGYAYKEPLFLGDEIYPLPPDTFPNAIESHENAALGAGDTDDVALAHASSDLTLAADGQEMQFTTGATSSDVTDPFTLMPGEARSISGRFGFVSVENMGGSAGGYRILNLYVSQTL
jgi:hypothetical protein